LLIAGRPLLAHHSFSAEFDAKNAVHLRGTVKKVEWANPHAWIHVDVKKPDGSVETWMVEGGTPNVLFRRGITKNSLPPGLEIVVDGFQSIDGSLRASGRDLTLPDGRQLFLANDESGR
jgi:hypothetical protein